MKPIDDLNRPVTVKDLEEMAVLIINSITEVLKGYATKEDIKELTTKVDNLSYDVSDIRRRVIDLETDRIGRQEFVAFQQKVNKS